MEEDKVNKSVQKYKKILVNSTEFFNTKTDKIIISMEKLYDLGTFLMFENILSYL